MIIKKLILVCFLVLAAVSYSQPANTVSNVSVADPAISPEELFSPGEVPHCMPETDCGECSNHEQFCVVTHIDCYHTSYWQAC